ncbi:hypothetical protein C1I63_06690 [Rathayibacter caricis DSM 15933]|uniref:Uncharacterized protein n=1 Tax=Rathayibacter caricis DSM 15933 TaxID=1328867 RepID=A0A2T4USS8_9MICO|nr:hypothetical protein [Rathayibacter caricis]PTL72566.1 hypothetical protein C1I63_06690 [Rathayibacter caricis DSM 15933]
MTDPDAHELRRLIRAADPASSLAPLRDDQLARLVEDAMTQNPARTTARRRAPLFAGLGALAGGLAAAAVALTLALGPGSAPTRLDQPPAGSGLSAMCAVVTAEAIADSDTAFRAEVTGIDGDVVTLSVLDVLHGEVGDTVTAPQGGGTAIDGEPLQFAEGETYLLATRDGVISTCGLSGEDSPELEALYTEAFGG